MSKVICVLGLWAGLTAAAQTPGAAAAAATPPAPAVKKTCPVDNRPPNPAETALNKREYASAEKLFRELLAKTPNDGVAHEGLVRTLIEQNKVDDAAKDAEAWASAEPANSMALTALGDVRFRQGVPREGFVQFQKAAHADLCNARALYGIAEVNGLAGYHALAKRAIEQAHALHPSDDDIAGAWTSTRPRAERLAMWQAYAEHSDQISDDDRKKLKARLEKQSLYKPSDCKATPASPSQTKVEMAPVSPDLYHFEGWGLDVKFNGKRRRLQIDTGASGIMITREASAFLGIKREDIAETGGIGGAGAVKTSIAHVASIKIGDIDFTNCPVEILEKLDTLDSDGLIGGDVFSGSLLTLDFPKHELRIDPLPAPPGEKASEQSLNTSGEDQEEEMHDPYVAPGMEKWQWIYRRGHELLIPTGIVRTKQVMDQSAWKEKLFMLDTGAEVNLISPKAARDVTKVAGGSGGIGIHGISGEVEKVSTAGEFTLGFAQLRLNAIAMLAVDMTNISHGAGVEVSGLIGAPALFQTALHIDYRDNLVMFEYKPQK